VRNCISLPRDTSLPRFNVNDLLLLFSPLSRAASLRVDHCSDLSDSCSRSWRICSSRVYLQRLSRLSITDPVSTYRPGVLLQIGSKECSAVSRVGIRGPK
jgi:hypothetical protein